MHADKTIDVIFVFYSKTSFFREKVTDLLCKHALCPFHMLCSLPCILCCMSTAGQKPLAEQHACLCVCCQAAQPSFVQLWL